MAAADVRRSFGGERYVSEIQRGRLLSATFALVGEAGYEGVNARRVSERAGVSNRTFYESFSDREDCFLAAFNYAVDGLELEVREGWESQLGWTARVRGALTALLMVLDREPAVRRLVFVEALAAGPRVLVSRARVIDGLAGVVDQGRSEVKTGDGPPPLTGEGVVGAVLSVIHGRMLEEHPACLVGLLNALVGMIVLPYLGQGAAAEELEHPAPGVPRKARGRSPQPVAHPLRGLEMRLTGRTLLVLVAISELAGRGPGPSNRQVAEHAGVTDQGQISKLLARLERLGLTQNTGDGHAKGAPNAWRLTPQGRQLARSISGHDHRRAA